MGPDDSIFFVGVRPTFTGKRLIRKRVRELFFGGDDAVSSSGTYSHVLARAMQSVVPPRIASRS
jgi:hypothetical protein